MILCTYSQSLVILKTTIAQSKTFEITYHFEVDKLVSCLEFVMRWNTEVGKLFVFVDFDCLVKPCILFDYAELELLCPLRPRHTRVPRINLWKTSKSWKSQLQKPQGAMQTSEQVGHGVSHQCSLGAVLWGFFGGQNYEREYLNVLSNKSLLYVTILI